MLSGVLGMSEAAIDELYEAGVVAKAPREGLVNPRKLELAEALADGRLAEIDARHRERFGL